MEIQANAQIQIESEHQKAEGIQHQETVFNSQRQEYGNLQKEYEIVDTTDIQSIVCEKRSPFTAANRSHHIASIHNEEEKKRADDT